jgi:hypothetical protein
MVELEGMPLSFGRKRITNPSLFLVNDVSALSDARKLDAFGDRRGFDEQQ